MSPDTSQPGTAPARDEWGRDPSVPPISWCRIFQTGPACKHLCADCATTYRRSKESTRA